MTISDKTITLNPLQQLLIVKAVSIVLSRTWNQKLDYQKLYQFLEDSFQSGDACRHPAQSPDVVG